MSQHDFDISTSDANTGSTMRAQINSALQALAGLSSGATEPGTRYPYMLWADTTTGLLKRRNAANSAWITIGQLDGDSDGRKNQIINGNFDFWQRGTSFSSAGYTADRFKLTLSSSTAVQTRQSFTIGQSEVPNNPEYYNRTVVTSASSTGSYARLSQFIEDVTKLAGKTVTLSFWAKANSSKNIAVEFVQYFGSSGSPSSDVTASVTTCALTTAWSKKTVTVTLPSVSGKTLGSAGDDSLAIFFWFESGSTYNTRTNSLGNQSGTFEIAQVQLEVGSIDTAFEYRPIGQELSLCQRYYEKKTVSTTISLVNSSADSVVCVQFSTKRVAPTCACTAATYSTEVGGDVTDTPGNWGAVNITTDSCAFARTPALTSRGYVKDFTYTVSAEL